MSTGADTFQSESQAFADRERRRLWLSAGSAVVVSAVGAAALIGSRTYPYWTPLGPGPGFFPRWLGGILIVGGLLWLTQLLRAARTATTTRSDTAADGASDHTPASTPASNAASHPVSKTASGAGSGAVSEAGSEAMVVAPDEAPEYHLPTVLAIIISLCALAATLEILGYQIAMFIFVLFHLLVLGRRRLLLSLVLALVCSLGVFVAFTRFLTVPLPASTIPFLRDMGF